MSVRGVTPAHESARSQRTWTDSIQRALRRAGITVCLITAISGLAMIFGLGAGASRLGPVGLSLTVAAQAAIISVLVLRLVSRWATGLIVLTSVLGIALALPAFSLADRPADWWPSQFVFTLIGFVVYIERSWHRWWVAGCLLILNGTARILTWPAGASHDLLVRQVGYEAGQAALIITMTYFTVEALLSAARTADHALNAVRRQRTAEFIANARTTRARELDRFIHDDVLHTLRIVALDRRAVPADVAIEGASQLANSMLGEDVDGRAPAGESGLGARLAQVTARLPLTVTLAVSGSRTIDVPPDVEDSFARAVTEALRNVVRHAGTARAWVRLHRAGLHVVVTVTDRGCGFDPDAVHNQRRGVSASIADRMHDIGGSAAVRSEPGAGSTVTLTWAPRHYARSAYVTGAASGAVADFFPAAVKMCLPPLLVNVWAAVWMAPLVTRPILISAVSLIIVVAGLVACAAGIRRGLRGRQSAVLTIIAWGGSATNGLVLPPGFHNTALYWLSGGAASIVLVQALFRPVLEAVICGVGLVAMSVGMCWRLLGDPTLLPTYSACILAPVMAVVVGVLVRRTVDVLSWDVLRSQEYTVRSQTTDLRRANFEWELTRRMSLRHNLVLEFVQGVAGKRLDVSDPSVQARAGELERQVREQVFQQLPADIQGELDRLAELGCQVTVRIAPEISEPAQQSLTAALIAAQADQQSWPAAASATATAAASGAGWRSSLRVNSPPPQVRDALAQFARTAGWAFEEGTDHVHLVHRITAEVL